MSSSSSVYRLTPAWGLALLAVGMLVPVTLPVPVLRELVVGRFGVSTGQASLFMSINMVGAFLAAPLAGALADRLGKRRTIIVGALLLDALCFLMLTQPVSFGWFLAIRFVEGCAHITALSLLLSIATDVARVIGRGRTMGFVGAGITFGVAMGAPIGGQLGKVHPLLPLEIGAGISGGLALVAVLFLREPASVGSRRPGLGEIVTAVKRDLYLLVPLSYAFVDRFTVGFFTTTFTLWMKEVHELPPDRIGMLLGLFLGPFSLLSYPFGRLSERVSRTALVAGGSFVYGVGLITLGQWDPDQLPLVMVALGVTSAVMFVPSLVMTTELADSSIRSTAMGGFNAAGSLGFVAGPLVGGYVSEFAAAHYTDWDAGYSSAFVVAGSAEVLCVMATLPLLMRLRRRGRTS